VHARTQHIHTQFGLSVVCTPAPPAEPRFGGRDKSATSRKSVTSSATESATVRRRVGAKSATVRRRSAPDMCGAGQTGRSALVVGKVGGGWRRFGGGRRQVGVKSATVGDKSATVGAHHTWLRQPRGSAEVGDGRRRPAQGRRRRSAPGRRRSAGQRPGLCRPSYQASLALPSYQRIAHRTHAQPSRIGRIFGPAAPYTYIPLHRSISTRRRREIGVLGRLLLLLGPGGPAFTRHTCLPVSQLSLRSLAQL
jgi:hypothetical protein